MLDFSEKPEPSSLPDFWRRVVRLWRSMPDPRWLEAGGTTVFPLAVGANTLPHGLRRAPVAVDPVCRGVTAVAITIESIGERTFVARVATACTAQFQVWP